MSRLAQRQLQSQGRLIPVAHLRRSLPHEHVSHRDHYRSAARPYDARAVLLVGASHAP